MVITMRTQEDRDLWMCNQLAWFAQGRMTFGSATNSKVSRMKRNGLLYKVVDFVTNA